MKRFVWSLLVLLFMLTFASCEKKDSTKPIKIHWDRDMCERCDMAISERKYAVQIINPKTGKHHLFDDIGCAILWMDEEKIPWRDRAIIWVTDAKTGKWIDAKKALWTDDRITPMAYGVAAFTKETLPKGEKPLTLKQAIEVIHKVEEFNKKRDKNR